MWKSRKIRHREARVATLRAIAVQPSALPPPEAAAALQAEIEGHVVVPTDADYDASRQLFSHEFQDFPQIIVYCEVFEDVRRCLKFARKYKLSPVVRSGGHSTAGYSINSDMVIDVSRLSYVVVDPGRKRAVVGAGTTFGRLNATLNTYRLHVPGGACEDVAIAGYMQGGGYGFTSREYGMNCDNVVEALVMLADGRIVVASATRHSDLFWAIRGGTGNNFGILLQVTYQLHDLWKVWGFGLLWPLEDAPAALVELQRNYMRQGAPDQLGYMVIVTAQQGRNVMLMRGTFNGTRRQGMAALSPLLKTKGVKKQIDFTDTYLAVNRYIVDKPFPIPDVPNAVMEDKQSLYIADDLKRGDWEKILRRYAQSPSPWSWFVIEPYGGKINRVPTDATAFIHRQAAMDAFFGLFWRTPEERAGYEGFLDQFMKMLKPYGNGHSYQNYPRRQQKNFASAYWGDSYSSLAAIKQKYDPDNFFRFQQSIAPKGAGARRKLVRPPDPGRIVPEPF
jgi:FAD/FMN-containing dehydrogenase